MLGLGVLGLCVIGWKVLGLGVRSSPEFQLDNTPPRVRWSYLCCEKVKNIKYMDSAVSEPSDAKYIRKPDTDVVVIVLLSESSDS